MLRSSSGSGHRPLTAKIAGSNPVRSTNFWLSAFNLQKERRFGRHRTVPSLGTAKIAGSLARSPAKEMPKRHLRARVRRFAVSRSEIQLFRARARAVSGDIVQFHLLARRRSWIQIPFEFPSRAAKLQLKFTTSESTDSQNLQSH